MKARAVRGFTLLEVMITVGVVGILSAIAIINVRKARDTAAIKLCEGNLSQISRAKIMWAMENKKDGTDTPTDTELFAPDSYLKRKPVCPSGGIYTIGMVSTNPTCSVTTHVAP